MKYIALLLLVFSIQSMACLPLREIEYEIPKNDIKKLVALIYSSENGISSSNKMLEIQGWHLNSSEKDDGILAELKFALQSHDDEVKSHLSVYCTKSNMMWKCVKPEKRRTIVLPNQIIETHLDNNINIGTVKEIMRFLQDDIKLKDTNRNKYEALGETQESNKPSLIVSISELVDNYFVVGLAPEGADPCYDHKITLTRSECGHANCPLQVLKNSINN